MKAVILILSVLVLVSYSNKKEQPINIFDAINNNQIKFKAIANGGHALASIVVEIEKTGNINSIIIPSGTRFISEHEGDQDLLNVDEEIIVLKTRNTQHVINGYCVQKLHSSPEGDTEFTLAKEQDKNLIKLANYLNKKEIDPHIKQTSLWCVSNGTGVSGIYDDGNEQVKKLRAYVCDLTDQKDVWYNTNPSYSIDENRNIISETTKVEGNISYKVTKKGSLAMEVCDESGAVIRSFGGSSPVNHLGDYKFNFKVTVKGWEAGSYSVRVKIGEDEIHRAYFEVG